MSVDVTRLWVCVWHWRAGGLTVEPALEYLREVNLLAARGEAPAKVAVGIFEGLEEGLEYRRLLRGRMGKKVSGGGC